MANELHQRAADADRMRAAHVERARYHADLARRRYLAVDPANRLVADSLEADWNTALRELGDAQHTYQQARDQHSGELTDQQRARINQLVTDLPAIWHDPTTPARERKRIARLLLTDVTVHRARATPSPPTCVSPPVSTPPSTMPAPKTAAEQRKTPAEVVTAINELLDRHVSGEIADILNQRGILSGTGEPFHRNIIDNIIHTYRLPQPPPTPPRRRHAHRRRTRRPPRHPTRTRQRLVACRTCQRAALQRQRRNALPPARPRPTRPNHPNADDRSKRADQHKQEITDASTQRRCSMQPEVCPWVFGPAPGRSASRRRRRVHRRPD